MILEGKHLLSKLGEVFILRLEVFLQIGALGARTGSLSDGLFRLLSVSLGHFLPVAGLLPQALMLPNELLQLVLCLGQGLRECLKRLLLCLAPGA